jgi:hypothetical protein
MCLEEGMCACYLHDFPRGTPGSAPHSASCGTTHTHTKRISWKNTRFRRAELHSGDTYVATNEMCNVNSTISLLIYLVPLWKHLQYFKTK